MKLNNEIRSLLVKNEIEENNSVLTTKNKIEKNVIAPILREFGRR